MLEKYNMCKWQHNNVFVYAKTELCNSAKIIEENMYTAKLKLNF